MAIDPVEHDTKTAELHEQAAKIQRDIDAHDDRMHRMAGDRKSYVGRRQCWKMTAAFVHQLLNAKVAEGDKRDLSNGMKPSEALHRYSSLRLDLARVVNEIQERELVWRGQRWSRFILCMSSNGHIHNFTGCHTLRPTSMLQWHPEFSGKSEAEAVKVLGPILCTHCFPTAPVEFKRDPAEVNREAREAEKTAKAAAKAEAEAAKAAKAAERAARPKKVTPTDRRIAGLNALHEKYPSEAAVLEAGRDAVATEIEKLLDLGRAQGWRDMVTSWAAAMRDEDNPLSWAWYQLSIFVGHQA